MRLSDTRLHPTSYRFRFKAVAGELAVEPSWYTALCCARASWSRRVSREIRTAKDVWIDVCWA
eukprot:scaffold69065_cov75-Phaeocystis_antarctica.AAC.7